MAGSFSLAVGGSGFPAWGSTCSQGDGTECCQAGDRGGYSYPSQLWFSLEKLGKGTWVP